MQRLNHHRHSEIIAALFILLFTYTAVSKFLKFSVFQIVLGSSPLIEDYATIVSWSLPAAELLVSGLLLFPSTRRTGLKLSLALMLIFTGYLGYMLTFTPKLPCSCGGVLQQMSWKQHFWFNIFFTGLAVIGIYLPRSKRTNYYPSI